MERCFTKTIAAYGKHIGHGADGEPIIRPKLRLTAEEFDLSTEKMYELEAAQKEVYDKRAADQVVKEETGGAASTND